MKNTGIEYLSTERTPTVLPEFSELLPPLTDEQLSLLEADLLQNGCYAPIIVNEELVIIDGHNRLNLCEKHGLPYRMAVFSFEDALEAKQWALDTQKGRRNLEKWELGKIALKLKPDVEARALKNKGVRSDLPATLPEGYEPTDTRKELADSVGLGERTMGKVMQIDEHAPEPIKKALDKKEISINQGYEITKQVQDLPVDGQEAAARQAVELAKAEKQYRKDNKAVDDNTRIARQFSAAFEKATLLDASEKNIRAWIEWSGIRKDEIGDMIAEADTAAKHFGEIADVLREIYEKEVAQYEKDDEEAIQTEDTE